MKKVGLYILFKGDVNVILPLCPVILQNLEGERNLNGLWEIENFFRSCLSVVLSQSTVTRSDNLPSDLFNLITWDNVPSEIIPGFQPFDLSQIEMKQKKA